MENKSKEGRERGGGEGCRRREEGRGDRETERRKEKKGRK